MRLHFSLILACVAAQLGCVAPIGNCSLMDCADHLTVQLEPPIAEEGTYEVHLEVGQESLRCTSALPPPERYVHCGIDGGGSLSGLQLRHSEEGALVEVGVWGAPGTALLTISRDGVEIVSETLRPTYERSYPNSESCDGDYYCKSATVVVEVH